MLVKPRRLQFLFFFKFIRHRNMHRKSFCTELDFTEIETTLLLKRKFGLLKYRFNEKAFLLYKLSSFLDIRKDRLKLKKTTYKYLKKPNVTKVFFKKNRENVFMKTRFKTTRQFKKSKLLYGLFNKKNSSEYNHYNNIVYTLLSFKLFLNFKDAIKYLKSLGFYYNNYHNHNPFQLLKMNDVFSLNADFYFYYYLKSMYKYLRKYFRKVKPRIFKLIRHKVDNNKQSATTFPKWTLKFSSFKDHKVTNIEFDLSILTFVVIYNFNYFSNVQFNNNMFISLYMTRLYNWRYIV